MKEISSYIIEKLHIDKNIVVKNRIFVGVFGLSDDKKSVVFKDFNTEKELKKYVNKHIGKTIHKRDLLCYDCPSPMEVDLLDMCCRSYNDEFGWAALDEWCQKNDIKYIYRNDILTEKLHLNKDIETYTFNEDDFKKIMQRYRIGEGSEFRQEVREWFKENDVNDIKIYGWENTNNLMEVETYVYDEDERKRLMDILLKEGEYKQSAKIDDKAFYWTNELFGYITKHNKNLSLIVKKIA